jgi:pimeloyl-ACP methyl ester carboxylesterase
MNRFFTHLWENFMEIAVNTVRFRKTPNQFKVPDEGAADWLSETPETFYTVSDTPPELEIASSEQSKSDGTAVTFRYPSQYASPHPENNMVHGLADLRPNGQGRAALVFLHGHSNDSFDALGVFTRPAMQAGFDVYYIALPYHMERAPQGTWSGQYAFNSNIEQTALAFKQSVMDVRTLVSWILSEKGQPVAVGGASYGAYVSCLTALVDDRPCAIISLAAGASFADVLWAGFPFRALRGELETRGVTPAELDQYWRLLGPGNWPLLLPRERVLLVAGEHDPIVTATNVETLWHAWGEPGIQWYPCGHTSMLFYAGRVARDMAHFLEECI